MRVASTARPGLLDALQGAQSKPEADHKKSPDDSNNARRQDSSKSTIAQRQTRKDYACHTENRTKHQQKQIHTSLPCVYCESISSDPLTHIAR
jgi:hypothetical protein